MVFDMGSYGIQIMVGFAFGFGAIAQLIAGRRANRWLWVAGSLGWIAGAVFASEVLVGRMTADEIQPIIDGLAFDEALLGGLVGGVVGFLAASFLGRGLGSDPATKHPAVGPAA